MVCRAITSAKKHGINLRRGTPNQADGNCAIESAIFNLNDRLCFPENLPFSVDYYRRIWMTDMKIKTLNDSTWNIHITFCRMSISYFSIGETVQIHSLN